jgi:hypothetical protein
MFDALFFIEELLNAPYAAELYELDLIVLFLLGYDLF